MPFGPIIDAELKRLARHRRWYVLRFALGLGLLLLVYHGYSQWAGLWPGMTELNDWYLQMVASRILYIILIGQTVAVAILAPLLAAGAVAEEKGRKTLHYLLSSRLSGPGIILGKAVARLLLVLMLLAMTAPLVVILSILGRVEPRILLAIYAPTLTTVAFEVSLAILISTLARRGRDALLVTIVVGLAWFAAPTLLENVLTDLLEPWPSIYYRWIEPINGPLIELSPLTLTRSIRRGFDATMAEIGVMMVHQAVGVAAMLALASWALRPAFRRQGDSSGRRPLRSRLGRLLALRLRRRHPVGDAPMLWKETHGTPGSRLVALISIASAVTVVLIGHDSFSRSIPQSWRALLDHGYRIGPGDPRQILNVELRVSAAGLFAVWSLLMMIVAATSVSREREDDTWISLVSTPLEGREILGAKLLGAAWSCRHLAYAILGLIAFGAVLGAFHPLGALIGVAQSATFGLFVVALGTMISIRARTTTGAIGAGVIALVVLGLIAPMMIASVEDRPGPAPYATSQPLLLGMGLLSQDDVADVRGYLEGRGVDPRREDVIVGTWAVAVGSLAYLALGPILLAWAYRRFDRLLDRPRRPLMAFEPPARPTSAAPAAGARASLPAGRA